MGRTGSYIGGIGGYAFGADSYNKLIQPTSQRRKRRVLFSQAQVRIVLIMFWGAWYLNGCLRTSCEL